jgi:hypothetical protein
VEQPVWFNRVDDPTRPFLSFLAVRWVLTETHVPPPPGWPTRAEGSGLRLLENPTALPLAFVPKLTRREPDAERRLALLRSITDFGERGVVEDGAATDWIPNAPARVSLLEAHAGGAELDVRAEGEALIATSIPAWPGWRGEIGGAAIEPILYNHAFFAWRIPAGSNRLTLRYMPDGFRLGALVSAMTAVLAAVILFRAARRKVGENPPE